MPANHGAQGSEALHCTLAAVPSDSEQDAVLAVVAAFGTAGATVVNLCVMATSQSTALAAALASRGENYLDAALTGTSRDVAQGTRAVLGAGACSRFQNMPDRFWRPLAAVCSMCPKNLAPRT
ncbi:NAD(P)-binding domain-containing protein [Polaromonas sp. P1(28)-13]|nr:NAD(P)-binding domain-containing protein [Polaromonas sp. P1(28)-13]